MNDRLQMCVVEIENMARDAVDEGRVHDVEPLAATQPRGLRGTREGRERADRDIDRLMTRAADRDADPVQQRPHTFLANLHRQVVIGRGHDVAREGASYAFRRRAIGVGARRGSRCLRENRAVAAIAIGTATAVCITVRRSVTGISAASWNEVPTTDALVVGAIWRAPTPRPRPRAFLCRPLVISLIPFIVQSIHDSGIVTIGVYQETKMTENRHQVPVARSVQPPPAPFVPNTWAASIATRSTDKAIVQCRNLFLI